MIKWPKLSNYGTKLRGVKLFKFCNTSHELRGLARNGKFIDTRDRPVRIIQNLNGQLHASHLSTVTLVGDRSVLKQSEKCLIRITIPVRKQLFYASSCLVFSIREHSLSENISMHHKTKSEE